MTFEAFLIQLPEKEQKYLVFIQRRKNNRVML